MTDRDRQAFLLAFPWWADGQRQHGWTWDVDISFGLEEFRDERGRYHTLHDPSEDKGHIELHMPGASLEQQEAVLAWLTNRFGPTKLLESPKTI